MTHRVRTREVPQLSGTVYKTAQEGLEGIAEWVKMAALLPLLAQPFDKAGVAASIARLQRRAPDAVPPDRAEEARAAAGARSVHRGAKFGFPGGREVYKQWGALRAGDAVGTPALTSASLCLGCAASFLAYGKAGWFTQPDVPSVMFTYIDVPDGLRMWESSAWADEVELLLGCLIVWRVAEAPALRTYKHEKKGQTSALNVRLVYDRVVGHFLDPVFRKEVLADAAEAERVLRLG
eukprot:gene1225-7567_t